MTWWRNDVDRFRCTLPILRDGRSGAWCGLLLGLIALLGGCATAPHAVTAERAPPAASPAPQPAGLGWAYVRWRIHWPEQQEQPSWYVDALLAHQVVQPVLARFGGDIPLWRIHRRATRAAPGHQFSFIFYTRPDTAREVAQTLRADRLVKRLMTAGVVDQAIYDTDAASTRPAVEATSDPDWPPQIMRSWPYYAMGASRMWIDLVAQVSAAEAADRPPGPDTDALLAHYRKVNEIVTALWREYGGHALLHHLDAIFGYESLFVTERRLMRF
jgi:hypothetical protein